MNSTHLITSLFCAAILALSSCCDDCPSCPVDKPEHEPDYHLLYSYVNGSSYYTVITYSLKYGTVVDSAFYPCSPFWDVAYTPDGEYACYTRSASFGCDNRRATWVTRTRGGDTVAISHDIGGKEVDISLNGKYLVISESKHLTIFGVPNLDIVYVSDSASYYSAVFHPFENKVFFTMESDSLIYEMTFDSYGMTALSSIPLTNRAGVPVYGLTKSISPDGQYLIIDDTEKSGPSYVHVLHTQGFEIVHEFLMPWWRDHGWHSWHPDGQRLFMSYNEAFVVPDYGGIDVYDVTTGVLQDFISMPDVDIAPDIFLPTHIQFTPEGDRMIVLCGGFLMGAAPVVTIDMATKCITQKFDSPPSGWARAISLIPIDWEKE